MTLSNDEFWENLCLYFGQGPLGIWNRCDIWVVKITVHHDLQCSNGVLIVAHNNDVTDDWNALCAVALTPKSVSQEPSINYGEKSAAGGGMDQEEDRVGSKWGEEVEEFPDEAGGLVGYGNGEACVGTSSYVKNDSRGDKGVHGILRCCTTCIFDIWVADLDVAKYRRAPAMVVMAKNEQQNKTKYPGICLEMRREFTALFYLLYGIIGEYVRATEKHLACLLANKWHRNYSEMVGSIRSQM